MHTQQPIAREHRTRPDRSRVERPRAHQPAGEHPHDERPGVVVAPRSDVTDLEPELVATVIADVAADVLATHAGPFGTVQYLAVVDPAACAAVAACVPLPPLLGVRAAAVSSAGHLHRADPAPDVATAAVGDLDVHLLAGLVASGVDRDLADVALARSQHHVANLNVALQTNRTIGMAMGVLMATRHCTAEEAFTALRLRSQNTNRKPREIADEVLYAGTFLDPV